MSKTYDFVVVGAGLFGATVAYEVMRQGYSCLVVDKRGTVGGNLFCEQRDGIDIHMYGAHIFHTNKGAIWEYVQKFATFNHYVNSPIANFHGQLYNLPFNMNTFYRLWGVTTPREAARVIEEQQGECAQGEARNLEEQAMKLVGRDIYEKLIKGYTEKQWGRACTELPAAIIRRLPVRFRFDNNYFDDPYQGIPIGSYKAIIEAMLEGATIEVGVDFNKQREKYKNKGRMVVYTGPLDSLYDYVYGKLEYRSVWFDHQRLEEENHQGVAVMNYTDRETPYTRVIEHKHFTFGAQPVTWISYEYPVEYEVTGEPYYPIGDEKNRSLYQRYRALAEAEEHIAFGGRLAEYAYYDMDKTILCALDLVKRLLGNASI